MKTEFRYLLDTDTSSYIIRGVPAVLRKAMLYKEQFAISSVTRFELNRARGELRKQNSLTLLDEFLNDVPTLNFEHESADLAASIFNELDRAGTRIGIPDSMLAGQAMAHGMIFVTNNLKHFKLVPGLMLENWLD